MSKLFKRMPFELLDKSFELLVKFTTFQLHVQTACQVGLYWSYNALIVHSNDWGIPYNTSIQGTLGIISFLMTDSS